MKKVMHKLASSIVAITMLVLPVRGYALPTDTTGATGATIVGGSASVDTTTTPGTMTVTSSTDRIIAEYNDFSIASGETVHFQQLNASSIALNRVVTVNPSTIAGRLTSNGNVWLLNPNGIAFTAGSTVDVNGLLASSIPLSTTDGDFLSGSSMTFTGAGAHVSNAGTIMSKPGGYVALLGSTIRNSGAIIADLGNVQLSSGNIVTVSLDLTGQINVGLVTPTTVNNGQTDAVVNTGSIRANGGQIILSAEVMDDLFTNAVNNSGTIEAMSLESKDGTITLDGVDHDTYVTGTVQASGDVVICGQNVTLDDAQVSSINNGLSRAYVELWAPGLITVKNGSVVLAQQLAKDFDANIYNTATSYDITDSTMTSEVLADGNSYFSFRQFDSGEEGYLNINNSELTSSVAGNGHAEFTVASSASWDGSSDNIFDYFLKSYFCMPFDGVINITDSTISVSTGTDVPFDKTSLIGIYNTEDINITGSDISATDNSAIAAIGIVSEDDINIDADSTITATSDSLAAVGIGAGDNLTNAGTVTADGGAGYGITGLLAFEDLVTGNAYAYGESLIMPSLEDLLNDYVFNPLMAIDLFSTPVDGGNGVIALSLGGDVYMGSLNADNVLVGAVSGSIYGTEGVTNANLLYMVAANDIGTSEHPILTDINYLGAYSFGTGSLYLNEAESLEVGVSIPFVLYDSESDPRPMALGIPVLVNNGTVNIVSDGDMIINSIVSPRGGVYLRTDNGSIYAGTGWDASNSADLAGVSFSDLFASIGSDVTDTLWYDDFGIESFMPFSFYDATDGAYNNVYAGGYSYFSAINGTIGNGAPGLKDAAMSGAVSGYVRPGDTVFATLEPSVDFDDILGLPSGYVMYEDLALGTGAQQVWPAAAVDTITFVNPLRVAVQIVDPAQSAVRPGFVPVSALTLQFSGTPAPTPDPSADGALYNVYTNLRVYYEILSGVRFASIEPTAPVTVFAYHPLTPTDSSSFDSINLDEGFYKFLDNSISLNNPLNSYFGVEEPQKKK